MAFPIFAAKAVSTGAVGVAAHNGAKKPYDKTPVRKAAVPATEVGLRAARKAESARLAVSDVVAEARDRLGEEVSPPVVSETGHGHSP